MKTALLTLIGLLVLVSVKPVFSQHRAETYSDPTYSTHNYKQINKAQIAQRWDEKSMVNVPLASGKEVALADYKQQLHAQVAAGGIIIDYKSSDAVAGWNYKTQHKAPVHENVNHKANHPYRHKTV